MKKCEKSRYCLRLTIFHYIEKKQYVVYANVLRHHDVNNMRNYFISNLVTLQPRNMVTSQGPRGERVPRCLGGHKAHNFWPRC